MSNCHGRTPAGPAGSATATLESGRLFRLLRSSHIFSSAVQELLEARYLSEVSDLGITVPQFHLLRLISLNGHFHVGEVAEFLGVSSPAASKNIEKLVRLGLVRRGTDHDDRRVRLLSISALGRALVRRYEEHKTERLAPVFQRFEPAEIDRLAHLLERFSVLMFDQERPEGEFCLRCAGYCEEDCPIGLVHGHCPYDKILQRHHAAVNGKDLK